MNKKNLIYIVEVGEFNFANRLSFKRIAAAIAL